MLAYLEKNKLVILGIDVLIMAISGITLLFTNITIFGIIFIVTVIIGLVFATMDIESREGNSREF